MNIFLIESACTKCVPCETEPLRANFVHMKPVLFLGWRPTTLSGGVVRWKHIGLAKSLDLEPNSLQQNGFL
ncbi:hypothetical protein CU103_07070 [Phyllobacterium sophorae]|uniref:Uncharacterized protein n=1 Tax=Phyllobacterium sophorae TaxID=1520277 RepID=A0A2P7BIM9_9HYPH|nr:hypothetical protein CU103_07070 [Phyllobacterium sophorae]